MKRFLETVGEFSNMEIDACEEEGKILGHIVTKDGVKIDPKRVEVINGISFPINKK